MIKDILGIKSKDQKVKNKNKVTFKLPINEVTEVIKGNNGTYKLCMKISPINGDLATAEQLEQVSGSIQGALSSFEGRRGIYILSERVDISSNIKSIENRMKELSDEFKISILESQKKDLLSMTSQSRTILNFYIVIEVKEKNISTATNMLFDAYGSIKNELESSEMYTDVLSEHEYKTLLYERINPEKSQVESYKEDWTMEDIYPDSAVRFEDGKHLEVENKLYRFLAISKYPQKVDEYRWLRKLFNIKGDVNIAIIMTPKNKATINKELSKAVSEIGGKAIAETDVSRKRKLEKEKESAEQLIDDLGNDNVSLFDTNITIGMSANNKEELNTLFNVVRSKISSSYLVSTEIKRKDFDPFYTVLPVLAENKITQNYIWNLTTKDVSSIIPFDSSEFMDSDGILIALNETSRGLVITNYRKKIYNNPHMTILADSGSGKTFFLRCDVIRSIPYVDYNILFDVKGDLWFPYGKRHIFSATSGIIVNPFHIRNAVIDSESENDMGTSNVGVFLSQKIMDLMVFFKWIVDLTPYDEALLEEDIRDTYTQCGLNFESEELPKVFCTMETLDQVMSRKIEMASNGEIESEELEVQRRKYIKACLRPYTKGTYSKIFNGQTNWDFDQLTVFDISNIPEAVQKPLYDILLKDTWQFCKKDGTVNPTLKNVYVDEAHEFADPQNPQTLKFLSTKLSKQGRGFGVRLVTATQNLPDFLSIPRYGQAIIDNSYFKLFMRLGESDIPVATKLYSFSPAEMRILKGSGSKKTGSKGKGIFIVGAQRVAVQTRASKDELEVIDPEQYEDIYGEKSRYYNQ